MIEYIRGCLAEITPTYAVVDAGGIGYMACISLATFEAMQNERGDVKLLVHEVIREDAHLLYGFATARERDVFRLLIGVSGVGPNTASLILSSLKVAELEAAIAAGDYVRLKGVKGIGLKTAQRIIVDLKDKINPADDSLSLQLGAVGGGGNEVFDEALAALTALGFPRPASQKVLRKIFEADPAVKIEAAIKKALSMM